MPTAVEVLHDDGRWYLAELLGQHRDPATDGLSTDRLGRPLPGPTARAGRRATRSTSRGRAGAHGRPGGPAQAWGVTSADGSGTYRVWGPPERSTFRVFSTLRSNIRRPKSMTMG